MAAASSETVFTPAGHLVSLETTELESSITIEHHVPEGFAEYKEWREKKQLVDATLLIGDKRIDTHKTMLSSRVPFFKAMFTSEMVERNANEINLNSQFCDFDADSIEQLINYTYTGKLEISEHTVQHLMMAANFLQLDAVLDECATFLVRRLKVCNAVSILLFCRSIAYSKIEHKVFQFIDKNFVTIAASAEFHQLRFENAREILQRDSINVDSEEQVFNAICSWIDSDASGARAKHMADLLTTVRISRIEDTDYIEQTMANNVHVLADPEAIDLIEKAKEYHQMTMLQLKQMKESGQEVFKTASRVCDSRNGVIFTVGTVHIPNTSGCNNADEVPKTSKVEMYDPMADRWEECTNMPSGRARVGLAYYKGMVYALGGSNGTDRLTTVQFFDVKENTWSDMADMTLKRAAMAVQVVDGIMYAIGGFDGTHAMTAAEAISLESNAPAWSHIQPLRKPRATAASCVLDGKIYVIGGHDGQIIHCDGEIYDPVSDSWTSMPPMKKRRCRFGAVVMNGKIWVAGGYDGAAFLKEVESFDPATNTWTQHNLMDRRRTRCALVVCCGKLFAIGGFDGLNNMNDVVRYDEDADEWTVCASMRAHTGGQSLIMVPTPANLATPVVNF